MLKDSTGKQMPAMNVFSACIRNLKDQLLHHSRKQMSALQESDIRWVITVPAIWNEPAKQFMREAALKVFFIFV